MTCVNLFAKERKLARATPTANLYDLTLHELETLMADMGFRQYHARQVWKAVYREAARSLDALDVPQEVRRRLADRATLTPLERELGAESADGSTVKVRARLWDGASIETVLIGYPGKDGSPGRSTVCVSTQAGCAVGCPFCATGEMGFSRNLTTGEIVAQVMHFVAGADHTPGRQPRTGSGAVDNVVFMGMGEPFLNYENTWRAIQVLSSPLGLGLGPRRFTVSTSGVVPGIRRMAGEKLLVNLAVSLHAPNDELRRRLVPISRKYPLTALMGACGDYTAATGRPVIYEYVLLAGVNDSPGLAHELGAMLEGKNARVNLIPVNPGTGGFERPSTDGVAVFQRIVLGYGVRTTVRAEKGVEIGAACGQLATLRRKGRRYPLDVLPEGIHANEG